MTDYIVAKSAELSKRYEARYVIVNEETGEILDDANGYGYKSIQTAHKGWAYKSKPKEEKDKMNKQYLIVMNWMKENKKVLSGLEDMYFYAFKDGVEVTNKDVEEVIGKHDEFTTKQFLYVYRNYNQVKRNLRKAGLIEERTYSRKRKVKSPMEQYINEFLNKLSESLTENDLVLLLEDLEENINLYDEKYFDIYIYDAISPLSFNEIEQKDFENTGYYKTNDGKYIMDQALF